MKHDSAGDNSGNSRNGKSKKALKGEFGELPLEVPPDRNSAFDPKIVPKGQSLMCLHRTRLDKRSMLSNLAIKKNYRGPCKGRGSSGSVSP